MRKALDRIIIEGRADSWRAITELRRAQLGELKARERRQPALFELREDHKPPAARAQRRGAISSRVC